MLNIKQLKKLSTFSITQITKDAGLKLHNVRSKIQFNRELKVDESQALEKAIEKYGIKLTEIKEDENGSSTNKI